METIKLGDCADIIRCQLPRSREVGAGMLQCREVTLAEVDPLSGFVEDEGGEPVWIDLAPDGKQRKYLLQPGDSVLAFRGTVATLGRIGYCLGVSPIPMVCGQSLAIIRPHAIDGLWLYYYLSRSCPRDRFVSFSTGDRLLTLNLGNLRELLISAPTMVEVEAIHRTHVKIVELAGQIRATQSALGGLLTDVEDLLAG